MNTGQPEKDKNPRRAAGTRADSRPLADRRRLVDRRRLLDRRRLVDRRRLLDRRWLLDRRGLVYRRPWTQSRPPAGGRRLAPQLSARGRRFAPRLPARGRRLASLAVVALALVALALSGCGPGVDASTTGVVKAVGAENQYANVIAQIGGNYVHVSAILDNPNTDPHTFESSPSVAREVSGAELIVQNGLGYDDFMNKIESATSGSSRHVIDVQHLLNLPDSTPNPHLWYGPRTMPLVAQAITTELSSIQPKHAAYFAANLQKFDASLTPWFDAIAAFKAKYGGTPVATTEPVADYLLQAMGADNLTPFSFQADVMNGTDPAPQDISLENSLFRHHEVKVFCYNEQVVDSLTASIRQHAEKNGVPVVAVYETMPTPGYDYQSWMLAETQAIQKAVTSHVPTEHL